MSFNKVSCDSLPAISAGGTKREWNVLHKLSQIFLKAGLSMEEYLNVVLKEFNRIDFPITLDPKTASFNDVAIHALLRQRLKKSTVAKRIAYAKFMEQHKVPVDFRNPNIDNFIRHMDYREQIENAGYGALSREYDTYKMFLKAYGLKISDFPYKPPSRPQYSVKIVPYPDQVNRILHLKYSKDQYENALIQYLLSHNFLIGWRIPSEPSVLKLDDVKIEKGYIIITEPKKHNSKRLVPLESAIIAEKRRKSLKNWIDIYRLKVENQYSNGFVYLKPNGRPFKKEQLRMFLNRRAAPLIKTVFPEYHNYIARDFAAISRLIRTKIQSKAFDIYEVKEWLGHTKIQTTMSYVKDAKDYYKLAPYDWINRVLKANTCEESSINQKELKKPAFDIEPFKEVKRTRRRPYCLIEGFFCESRFVLALLKICSILTKNPSGVICSWSR